MEADIPELGGYLLLEESLRYLGLPWVSWAVWGRPDEAWLLLADRLEAIALYLSVLEEMRRRLPPETSGAAIGREWRDAAWRCVVAGMAVMDAEDWKPPRCETVKGCAKPRAQKVTICRRSTRPIANPSPAPNAAMFRRRGGASRAT